MASKARDNFSDRILAIVQGSGPTARILVLHAEPGGLRFLEARTAEGAPSEILQGIWSRHGRGRVLRIVPGASSVCRVGAATTGSDAETIAALSLVGEALLPTDVPPHRRAVGVLAGTVATGTESRVLATAWVGKADAPLTVPSSRAGAPVESWITPVAALAGILSGPGMVAHVDADAHTIAILASGSQRAVARQLLGDHSSAAAWRASVDDAVQETARAAGLDPSTTAIVQGYASGTALLVSPAARSALRAAVHGLPPDDHWMNQHGLAIAAALIATGTPTVRSLAALTAEAPKIREPAPLRAAAWLAKGSRPRVIMTVGLALLLIGPVGFAFARHSVLKSKTSRLEEQKLTREQTQRQAALYSQLETSRWPVTKLLSDVAVATPIGVSVDTVNLSSEMGLKLAGRADSQALVNTLQSNLNSTKLFRNVKVGRTGSIDEGGVEFDITAEVANPHNKVTGMEDFVQKTLAVRLYGEGADNTKEAPPSDQNKSRRASRTDRPEDAGKDGSTSSRRGPADEGPPPALTDAEIAKLNKSEATMAWVKRKTYVQKNPNTDTETKDRLNAEVVKLKEQAAKAPAAPPAGGGK